MSVLYTEQLKQTSYRQQLRHSYKKNTFKNFRLDKRGNKLPTNAFELNILQKLNEFLQYISFEKKINDSSYQHL